MYRAQSAMYSATNQQANRPASARQTSIARQTLPNQPKSGKSDRPIDTRKTRDNDYTNQCAERVFNFMQDKGYQGAIKLQELQNGLALKPYLEMVNYLVDLLDVQIPTVPSDSKNYQDIGNYFQTIQTQLCYPETNQIKQADLKSCSQPQMWRKMMLFLSWLVELTDYALSVNLDGATDNDKPEETEQFIKRLCQSNDPESLLQSKDYFEFILKLYQEFLASQGNETDMKNSLETQFKLWSDDAKQNELKVQSEIKKLDNEIKRYHQELEKEFNDAKMELNIAAKIAADCEITLDLVDDQSVVGSQIGDVTCNQLLDLKARNLTRLEEANRRLLERISQLENTTLPTLQEKLQFANNQIEIESKKKLELQQEYESLNQSVQQQDISHADFVQLQNQQKTLFNQQQQLEKELQDLNANLDEKMERKKKIEKQIATLSQELHINPNLSIEEIQKLQQNVRKETFEVEKQHNELSRQYQQYESQKAQLETSLAEHQDALENAQKREQLSKKEYDNQFLTQKQKNAQYHDGSTKLQEEIQTLKDEKNKLGIELEQAQALYKQQQSILDKEQKRQDEELKKLVYVVGDIYCQIQKGRDEARNALEMARDKVCEALQNLKDQ